MDEKRDLEKAIIDMEKMRKALEEAIKTGNKAKLIAEKEFEEKEEKKE